MREHIQFRIEHKLPLTERERAYAILFMGYDAEQLEKIYRERQGYRRIYLRRYGGGNKRRLCESVCNQQSNFGARLSFSKGNAGIYRPLPQRPVCFAHLPARDIRRAERTHALCAPEYELRRKRLWVL